MIGEIPGYVSPKQAIGKTILRTNCITNSETGCSILVFVFNDNTYTAYHPYIAYEDACFIQTRRLIAGDLIDSEVSSLGLATLADLASLREAHRADYVRHLAKLRKDEYLRLKAEFEPETGKELSS